MFALLAVSYCSVALVNSCQLPRADTYHTPPSTSLFSPTSLLCTASAQLLRTNYFLIQSTQSDLFHPSLKSLPSSPNVFLPAAPIQPASPNFRPLPCTNFKYRFLHGSVSLDLLTAIYRIMAPSAAKANYKSYEAQARLVRAIVAAHPTTKWNYKGNTSTFCTLLSLHLCMN